MAAAKMSVAEELIREIAHKLWVEEGQPEGRAEMHWFKAISIANQQMAPKKKAATKKADAKSPAKSAAKSADKSPAKADTKTMAKKDDAKDVKARTKKAA